MGLTRTPDRLEEPVLVSSHFRFDVDNNLGALSSGLLILKHDFLSSGEGPTVFQPCGGMGGSKKESKRCAGPKWSLSFLKERPFAGGEMCT